MQIEDVVSDASSYNGTPHYFSAVLFEDWEFWSPGPSGPTRAGIIEQLALYQQVLKVQIVKTYVPFVC